MRESSTGYLELRYFRIEPPHQRPAMAARSRNGLSESRPSPRWPLALSNRAVGAANQKRLELCQSALLGRDEECGEETPLFCRIHGRVLTIGDMLPGAAHELAGIGFFEVAAPLPASPAMAPSAAPLAAPMAAPAAGGGPEGGAPAAVEVLFVDCAAVRAASGSNAVSCFAQL